MQAAICSVSVSPLRAEPSHKAEMVSELLFGESCAIVDSSTNHWIKVKCKYDGYEGWCQDNHLTETDQAVYDEEKGLTRKWVTEIAYNGHPMYVPMGSSLMQMKRGIGSLKENLVCYNGKIWNPRKAKKNKKSVRRLAFSFLNTPYLWGGKTVFGTDCSGYTQTVFRFLNVPLLRDAWQQATQGSLIDSLENASFGDLAFFDNTDGKITHVGILLNDHKIIHASGKVREDKIDNEGIINLETHQHTHRLKVIKRNF